MKAQYVGCFRSFRSVMISWSKNIWSAHRRSGRKPPCSSLNLLPSLAHAYRRVFTTTSNSCTAEPERALSKVFRHRCEQVKEGGAKGSLCAEYRDLLLKHDLGSQWEELPPDPRQWTDWDTRVHKVVALRDLADRKV